MSHLIQLDSRLSLAFELYDPCDLAADIGTDHAHLPAALLQRGRCQRMILTDISESALRNARDGMIRFGLTDRVILRRGDGLSPLGHDFRHGYGWPHRPGYPAFRERKTPGRFPGSLRPHGPAPDP